MIEEPILVVGATGKTGRRVAERLEARGLPVRTGSRSSEPPFDWEDQSTWEPALRGAGAVYLTSSRTSRLRARSRPSRCLSNSRQTTG